MVKNDLNKMSFEDLQAEVKRLESAKVKAVSKEDGWEIGSNYFIRTVTHAQVGKLVNINDKELILENASWIADTGRFHNMLKNGLESLERSEIEPFVNDVIVNRGAIIDATKYIYKLPITQK